MSRIIKENLMEQFSLNMEKDISPEQKEKIKEIIQNTNDELKRK
jgi:hypothetical protein